MHLPKTLKYGVYVLDAPHFDWSILTHKKKKLLLEYVSMQVIFKNKKEGKGGLAYSLWYVDNIALLASLHAAPSHCWPARQCKSDTVPNYYGEQSEEDGVVDWPLTKRVKKILVIDSTSQQEKDCSPLTWKSEMQRERERKKMHIQVSHPFYRNIQNFLVI